jgi:hypothetical protein
VNEPGEDKLLGHTLAELEREGGQTPSLGNPVEHLRELEKFGLHLETLAAAWRLEPEIIQRIAEDKPMLSDYGWSFDREMRDVRKPLLELTMSAWYALDPARLALRLIDALTTGFLRRGAPQLTLAGIARLCAVDERKLRKFTSNDEADRETPLYKRGLKKEEIYKLCVALLIVDRELNYRPRGDYFSKPAQEYIEIEDGRRVLANVGRFTPTEVN